MNGNAGNFLSPEALIIMPIALILDAIGIILVCFLLDDFFITDIIGMATIGVWSWFRGQAKDIQVTTETPEIGGRRAQTRKFKQAQKEAKAIKASRAAKTAKAAKWARWLRFIKFIPYLGALPLWTVSVYLSLKE